MALWAYYILFPFTFLGLVTAARSFAAWRRRRRRQRTREIIRIRPSDLRPAYKASGWAYQPAPYSDKGAR